ncbi:MAG: prepilin-type N-terminal cleavage/methylation domain-containing protein [Lachnospiraceae bacterium]|nr:prepilin-type N-terminal cleavage/methylation domain-containing protein [Lachnospiraceae bacterium]
MRGMRKNNKGYSLVELIVVIAIISVVGLGALWSIIMVFSANAKTCANDIIGAISECKITTMSKGQGNVRVIIYRSSNGNIYSELQVRESTPGDAWSDTNGWVAAHEAEKIGARKCSVGTTDGADDLPDKANAWRIYFDRSSGSFLYSTDSSKPNTSVTEIHVQGGRKNYCITLEELTGKTILELQ